MRLSRGERDRDNFRRTVMRNLLHRWRPASAGGQGSNFDGCCFRPCGPLLRRNRGQKVSLAGRQCAQRLFSMRIDQDSLCDAGVYPIRPAVSLSTLGSRRKVTGKVGTGL